MAYPKFHGIKLADNSHIKNLYIEKLATDPTSVQAGRVWFNSTDRVFKYSTLDEGGAVVIRTIASDQDLQEAVTNLQTLLNTETAAREAADTTLQGNIDSEQAARQAAIDTLTADLTTEVERAEAAEALLTANLEAEITRAQNAEADLYQEIDSRIAGLSWKTPVRVKSGQENGNITLSGLQTIDGVALAAGDRVLVNNQTDPTTHGIYVAAEGSWSRSEDMDQLSPNEFNMAAFFIEEGAVYGGTGWVQVEDVTAIGTSDINFVQFNGAAGITAGAGMVKDGNILNIIGGNGITANAESIDLDLQVTGGLQIVDEQVGVKLDGNSLTVSATGLKVSSVLTTEITALRTDLTQETADRVAAVDAEEAARIAAIDAEVAAREAADDALDARITTIESQAAGKIGDLTTLETEAKSDLVSAINEVHGDVVAEAAARAAADATLQSNIDGVASDLADEVQAREAADTAIRTEVNATKFVYTASAAAMSHTVAHNLGTDQLLFNVMVEGQDGVYRNDVVPVEYTDGNTMKIELSEARKIKVAVQSMASL